MKPSEEIAIIKKQLEYTEHGINGHENIWYTLKAIIKYLDKKYMEDNPDNGRCI